MTAATTTRRPSLFLSQDASFDRLSALEFGAIDDGQPLDRWVGVGEQIGLLHDRPGGRCIGFLVLNVSDYDPDEVEHAELWEAPRFDVPALGLSDAAPNEIIVATRALFGTRTTVNRELFSRAIGADGEAALQRWLRCLQAGDSMAHYGLGYTLYGLGRHAEAYRHLRHYTDLAPAEAWTWAWYARAAAAMGETAEARTALARAIELDDEDEYGAQTDAVELLEELDAGSFVPPRLAVAPEDEPVLQLLIDLLVQEIGGTMITANTDSHAVVLVAMQPPVWVHVDRASGDVLVRSQIGTVHPDDLYDEEVSDLVEDMGRHHRIEVEPDTGDVYLSLEVPGLFAGNDIRPGVLRTLVIGASTCARELSGYGVPYDIEILPARDRYDEYEHVVDQGDD